MNIPLGSPGDEHNAKRIMTFGNYPSMYRPIGTFLEYCVKEDPWAIIKKHHKYLALQEAYWQLWILSRCYRPESGPGSEPDADYFQETEGGIKAEDLRKSLMKFVKEYGEKDAL